MPIYNSCYKNTSKWLLIKSSLEWATWSVFFFCAWFHFLGTCMPHSPFSRIQDDRAVHISNIAEGNELWRVSHWQLDVLAQKWHIASTHKCVIVIWPQPTVRGQNVQFCPLPGRRRTGNLWRTAIWLNSKEIDVETKLPIYLVIRKKFRMDQVRY